MINAVFRLSRSAWGTLRPVETDLSQLVQEIATELRLSDPGRRAAVTIAPGLVARCDRELTRILLENLLENAWKYTAPRREARIEFGGSDEGGEKVFFVRDNGIGFDMSQAQEIFVPFFRIGAIKEMTGSGIGLATVQAIVQRHGGRVWVEGEKNKGARVFFTFSTVSAPISRGSESRMTAA